MPQACTLCLLNVYITYRVRRSSLLEASITEFNRVDYFTVCNSLCCCASRAEMQQVGKGLDEDECDLLYA